MSILDMLFNGLSKIPGAAGGTVAQDRYTHTPIVYQPLGSDPSWAGNYSSASQGSSPFWQTALQQGMGLGGIDPHTQNYIQIQQGVKSNENVLRHEIVHAATVDDLVPNSRIYANAQRALPQEVRDEIPRLWSNAPEPPDIVHEGVARFLTADAYKDPKYNKQKLALLNVFPGATKAKITRMLGQP